MPHARRLLVLILLAAALGGCASSSSNTPAPTVTPTASRIALVFDTGADADAGHTAEILDTLHRAGVRATFSVTGLWAEQHRDLLLAIAVDGHQIINGTYHGASFSGASTGTAPLTAAERTLELSRTEVTVYHLTGRSTRPYWRPPYGDIDDGARRDASAAGYSIAVLATWDSAAARGADADTIVDGALAASAPGAIYILYAGSASQDAAALQRIIDGIRAKGFAFATIEDVLAH